MKNKFEHILLSILLGLTVLLGLSFWLNTFFNFNIFCPAHWDELAKLQASQIPINHNFYISIGVAIFIFAFGLFVIYRKNGKNPRSAPRSGFARPAGTDYKRHAAFLLGEHVGDELRFAVLKTSKHNGTGFYEHNVCKCNTIG